MGKINVDAIKFTTPDSAYKAGERWYKTKLTNSESGEEFWQVRPIFILEKDGKLTVMASFLYKFFQMSETCVMLRNGALDSEIRYIYKNGVYETVNDNDIMRIFTGYIEDFNLRLLNTPVLKQALELSDCTCKQYHHDVMNTDEDIINFQNGLLNIRTLEFFKHTPDMMSSIQIPCNWNGRASPTPNFDNFLNTLTGNDAQTQKLILEYMGAILSNVQGWRFKKAMFLQGKGDTGKSTLINLITMLLGKNNVSESDLQKLNKRFGETAIYNKRLVYSNDLPFMKIEENAIFKNLTGGDSISIEFKHEQPFDYRFKGFILYGMNDLPHFGGDKGEHVYNRIIIIKCDNVISDEKKDPFLERKLFAEREGIIYKCIMALREAIDRKYKFSVNQKCVDNLTAYKRENSYPVEFWTTYLRPLKPSESPCEESQKVYNNFRRWCEEQGITRIPSFPEFRKEISSFCGKPWSVDENPTAGMVKRFGGNKGKLLIEFRMNEDWKNEREYLQYGSINGGSQG